MKLTSVTYQQDSDSCSDGVQTITIILRDAGGGDYYVIETEEWAIDTPEEFLELFKHIKGADAQTAMDNIADEKLRLRQLAVK